MNRSELYRQQLKEATEQIRTMRVFAITSTIQFPREKEATEKRLIFQGATPEEALEACKQMATHQKWEVKAAYKIDEITAAARPNAVATPAKSTPASEAVTAKASPQALATAPTEPAPPPATSTPATSSSSSEPHASTPASSGSSSTPATSAPSSGSTPATHEPPK